MNAISCIKIKEQEVNFHKAVNLKSQSHFVKQKKMHEIIEENKITLEVRIAGYGGFFF